MYLALVRHWIQSAEPQESHSVQSLSKFSFTGIITKAIYKSSEEDKKEEEVKKTLEQHDNIVTHYKNMIREQVSTSELYSQPAAALYLREHCFFAFHVGEGCRK